MSAASEFSVTRTPVQLLLWRYRLLFGIVSAHLLSGIGLTFFVETALVTDAWPTILSVLQKLAIFFAINLIIWRLVYGIIWERPKQPTKWLIADIRRILTTPEEILEGIIVFALLAVMIVTFISIKGAIPALIPFSWDPAFAALDRALHGGVDPWRLLMPVFGNPYMTTLLNGFYNLWFFLIYAMVFLAAMDRRDPRRSMIFLVAFALTWIVGGNLVAVLLSSAGPVYYEAMGFGQTFAPQMQQLQAFDAVSPVWALPLQDALLTMYQQNAAIQGISAMPSMHVGVSVLLALYGFAYSRVLGWVLSVFALFIMIGSVHLAWHYAVDGYLAAVLTLGCWWAARKLVDRFA